MDRPAESLTTPIYARLIYWFGPLVALLLAFQFEFSRIKLSFDEAVEQATYQIETKVNTFEVALEGFANFLAVSGDVGDEEIRAYIQGIRQLYPDLYMFEISSRVEYQQRHAFEQTMRAKGYRNFVIHGFDYSGERQVTSVGKRPVYYPIRFIEPESPDTNAVLGLDLASTSTVLIETMMKSLKSPRPLASRPFELLEGGKGYVIYRPAIPASNALVTVSQSRPLNFAMLAIRAEDLLPDWLQNQDSYTISLVYKQAIPTPHKEVLVEPFSKSSNDLRSHIIHSYSRTVDINNESQPFELTLEKNIRWTDFSPFRIFIIAVAGLILSFYIAHRMARTCHREHSVREKQYLLYHQANFDSLTDLPNINLLTDRAEQAIRIADRSGGRVAVCYLDIDKFKNVNDYWGHIAGDELLIEIAARLQKILREEDTPARIHGDEFIVLLPEVADQNSLDLVTHKIMSIFAQSFSIAGQQIEVKASIGTALFPDDAHDLESLLNISDKRMYKHKDSGVESLVKPTVDQLPPPENDSQSVT